MHRQTVLIVAATTLSAAAAQAQEVTPMANTRSERLPASVAVERVPYDGLVFATAASASSHYGAGYEARNATGKPRVFPKLRDTQGAWSSGRSPNAQWLEVQFPPTAARWVYVFESHGPGAIRAITTGTGERIYANDARPPRFREAQLLCVELPKALTITSLKIEVDRSLASWPEIDAVALGTAAHGTGPTPGAAPTTAAAPTPTGAAPKAPSGAAAPQATNLAGTRAERLGAGVALGRVPYDDLVFATGASASTRYGSGYEAESATGRPRVFPKLQDTQGAWCPAASPSMQWLEVQFPPTEARWVYVFESNGPGAIRTITTGTGERIYATDAPPAKYTEAQLLCVGLPKALTISSLKIELNRDLTDWPQIDTVALGTGGPAAAATGAAALEDLNGLDRWDQDRMQKGTKALEEARAQLEQYQDQTILTGTEGATVFDNSIGYIREQAAAVTIKDHPAPIALREFADELEQQVATLKQNSLRMQAELGDVDAQLEVHYAWIGEHDMPRMPETHTPASFRAYGQALRQWVTALQQHTDYVRRVANWDPRLHVAGYSEFTEMRNTVYRVLSGCKASLASPTREAEELEAYVFKRLEENDPDELTPKELRHGAFTLEKFGPRIELSEAFADTDLLVAFHEGFSGSVPASIHELRAALKQQLGALDANVAKQIASERLESGASAPTLLKQAHGLLPKALATVVMEEVAHHEGVWTEEDLVNETRSGNMVEQTFLVTKTPYDFERGFLLAAFPLDGRPDHCVVRKFEVQYNNLPYGKKPRGEWYVNYTWDEFVMLRANLPR